MNKKNFDYQTVADWLMNDMTYFSVFVYKFGYLDAESLILLLSI